MGYRYDRRANAVHDTDDRTRIGVERVVFVRRLRGLRGLPRRLAARGLAIVKDHDLLR
jgi:hypothetical protein